MLKNKFLRITRYALLITLFILPVFAHAQLVPCDGPGGPEPCTVTHLIQLGVNIYNFLLGIMASIAVLVLVWAGIRMLIYQYDEDAENLLRKAKLSVRHAVAGLIFIICAYLIVLTLLLVLGVDTGPNGVGSLRCFLTEFGFPVGGEKCIP